MDIQPRTYYRGLYGRESDVVLYPLLTVHVSPIYARSEYVYPPECEPSRGTRGGEGEYWTREKAEFRIVWGYYFMEVRVLWPDPRRYAGAFWIMYTVNRSCLPIRETDYSNGTMAPVILEFPGRVIEISYRHFSLEPTMIDTFRGLSHLPARFEATIRGQLFTRMTRRNRWSAFERDWRTTIPIVYF